MSLMLTGCRSEAGCTVQRIRSAADGRRTDDCLAAAEAQRRPGPPLHHRVPYSGTVGAAHRERPRRTSLL